MKKLLLVLLFVPLVSFGQDVNKESNGWTKVFNVELSADEIYAKVNEWVAETYKNPEEVTKLNSKSKLIVGGNLTINLTSEGQSFAHWLDHTLSISIRDNKYKADLTLGDVTNKQYPTMKLPASKYGLVYIKHNKEDYMAISKENLKAFYSGKKLEKNYQKFVVDKIDELYPTYEANYQNMMDEISSLYKSLEDKVDSSDDW
tara:strand:- start:472 stop:1077 length:606 start_codon:yes stop_codon:yes gene_type:complete